MFGLTKRGGKKSYKGKVIISRLSSRSAGWRFEIRKLHKKWAFKSPVLVSHPWKLPWKRLERLLSNAKASWLDGEFLKEFAWLPPARTPEKTSSCAGGSRAGWRESSVHRSQSLCLASPWASIWAASPHRTQVWNPCCSSCLHFRTLLSWTKFST